MEAKRHCTATAAQGHQLTEVCWSHALLRHAPDQGTAQKGHTHASSGSFRAGECPPRPPHARDVGSLAHGPFSPSEGRPKTTVTPSPPCPANNEIPKQYGPNTKCSLDKPFSACGQVQVENHLLWAIEVLQLRVTSAFCILSCSFLKHQDKSQQPPIPPIVHPKSCTLKLGAKMNLGTELIRSEHRTSRLGHFAPAPPLSKG